MAAAPPAAGAGVAGPGMALGAAGEGRARVAPRGSAHSHTEPAAAFLLQGAWPRRALPSGPPAHTDWQPPPGPGPPVPSTAPRPRPATPMLTHEWVTPPPAPGLVQLDGLLTPSAPGDWLAPAKRSFQKASGQARLRPRAGDGRRASPTRPHPHPHPIPPLPHNSAPSSTPNPTGERLAWAWGSVSWLRHLGGLTGVGSKAPDTGAVVAPGPGWRTEATLLRPQQHQPTRPRLGPTALLPRPSSAPGHRLVPRPVPAHRARGGQGSSGPRTGPRSNTLCSFTQQLSPQPLETCPPPITTRRASSPVRRGLGLGWMPSWPTRAATQQRQD